MKFSALSYTVFLSGMMVFNTQAQVRIELPDPQEFKALSPIFQIYEDEFQEWQSRTQFNSPTASGTEPYPETRPL